MPENDRQRIYHLRSDEITSGGTPKLPTSEIIDVGELAINYAKDYETLAIKNSSGDIVTFSSDIIIDSHISSAVTNINLGDLADVEISSVTNNQIVKYDSEQSGWVNTDISTLVRLAKDTTYDSILGDLTNDALVPNMLYRITDYVTTTTQDETRSAGHQFDLIVLATSVNTLDCQARAVLNDNDTYFSASGNVCDLSKWQIWYDINNDTTKYAWADSANGKGVIYRMVDDYGNDCPYDFKNIMFKRYAIDDITSTTSFSASVDNMKYAFCYGYNAGKHFAAKDVYGEFIPYNSNGVSYDIDEDNYGWYYTFHGLSSEDGETILSGYDMSICHFKLSEEAIQEAIDGGWGTNTEDECHDNTIKPAFYEYFEDDEYYKGRCLLNNIVFINGLSYCYYDDEYWECNTSNCRNNIFEVECKNNTFGNYCYSNTFGNYCGNNTFGNYCGNNTFGYSCHSNTFGNDCKNNAFGNQCKDNTFGFYCGSNTFGNSCGSNTFGDNYHKNTFGNQCNNNTFGNQCDRNTFGDNCNNNIFGNVCQSNTFGNQCNDNIFGNQCYSNTFGDNYHNNTFGNQCNNNTFGNQCYSNTFGDNCQNNTFENDCHNNTFGNECNRNTFRVTCTGNIFGKYCNNNIFGNVCQSNTFGNQCNDNIFGNYCNTNMFGVSCTDNKLGNTCSYIRFGNNSGQYGNFVRYVVTESGNRYIRLYSSASGAYLQNIYIAQGLNNTITWLDISTIQRDIQYRVTVARLSDNSIRIYREDEDDINPDFIMDSFTEDDWIYVFSGGTNENLRDYSFYIEDFMKEGNLDKNYWANENGYDTFSDYVDGMIEDLGSIGNYLNYNEDIQLNGINYELWRTPYNILGGYLFAVRKNDNYETVVQNTLEYNTASTYNPFLSFYISDDISEIDFDEPYTVKHDNDLLVAIREN